MTALKPLLQDTKNGEARLANLPHEAPSMAHIDAV